jgi:hypothetical protein
MNYLTMYALPILLAFIDKYIFFLFLLNIRLT